MYERIPERLRKVTLKQKNWGFVSNFIYITYFQNFHTFETILHQVVSVKRTSLYIVEGLYLQINQEL